MSFPAFVSFPGPCEFCGGPVNWCFGSDGHLYVSCKAGCSPLPGLGLDPPQSVRDHWETTSPRPNATRRPAKPAQQSASLPWDE